MVYQEIALSANGGKNNGDIKEVYAFFAPALGETEKIQFPERYYRGQENYVVKVDNANFTRDGYTFKEWTGDAAGTKPLQSASTSTTMCRMPYTHSGIR